LNVYWRLLIVIIALGITLAIVIIVTSEPPSVKSGEGSIYEDRPVPEGVDEAVFVYGGEIEGNGTALYGFGLDPDALTSPGPTLRFNLSSTIYVRFLNYGSVPHTWAITDTLEEDANVLFDARLGTESNPIDPLNGGADTFTVDRAGSFYYICTLSGHVEQGMWGRVEVLP
jgi:hypothetical protein